MAFNVGDEVRTKIGFFEKRPYGPKGTVIATSARTYTVQFVDAKNKVTEKKMRYCDHECALCPGEREVTIANNVLRLYNMATSLQKALSEPFATTDDVMKIMWGDLSTEVGMLQALLKRIETIAKEAKEMKQ